jgi:hypothetical protein
MTTWSRPLNLSGSFWTFHYDSDKPEDGGMYRLLRTSTVANLGFYYLRRSADGLWEERYSKPGTGTKTWGRCGYQIEIEGIFADKLATPDTHPDKFRRLVEGEVLEPSDLRRESSGKYVRTLMVGHLVSAGAYFRKGKAKHFRKTARFTKVRVYHEA